MKAQRTSIYQYDNYRNFLRSVLQDRKKQNPRFSLGAWARRLQLKSSSTLIMILNGNRNPGPELTEGLIRDLSLRSGEADYFRDLISFEKAQSDERLKFVLTD